ncbi:MAG: FAD-binding oxidoreductase [Syntrophorhabdales bacterium]|jgi:glycolate oxidase
MALSREVYQALEDIVGPDNISDDPALLDSYVYPLMATSLHCGPFYRVFTPRAGAVLLPASTEDVQAVVKVCNKHKIKYKASSTFWGAMGYPSHEDAVQLDMRRMNRIIEIDRKNMFAVIEPYVIGATLQAEAMKVGLNCHMIGAGAGCSPLVAATCYVGFGPDSFYMGVGAENLLGFEWVMPNGDTVKAGSLGSGAGWFCGEGPGPGIIGLIKGTIGARGGMGVFTKIALKLHPWPGPTTLSASGTPPAYRAPLLDNVRAFTVCFPSWQAFADSCYKLWNAGMGYIAHRQYNKLGRDLKIPMIKILSDPDKTLSDLEEMLEDPENKKIAEESKYDFELVLAGMTKRDIEWQLKALDEILAETGGWKSEFMSRPEIEQWSLLYMVRLGHKGLNLVYGGGYDGSFAQNGPPDFTASYIPGAIEFKKSWEKKGAIVAAGGDSGMGGIGGMGGGGSVGIESFVHFDPHDKFSTEGTFEYYEAVVKYERENGLPPGLQRLNGLSRGSDGREFSKEVRKEILSAHPQSAVFRYQTKIREIFNPNDLGDAYYVTI